MVVVAAPTEASRVSWEVEESGRGGEVGGDEEGGCEEYLDESERQDVSSVGRPVSWLRFVWRLDNVMRSLQGK